MVGEARFDEFHRPLRERRQVGFGAGEYAGPRVDVEFRDVDDGEARRPAVAHRFVPRGQAEEVGGADGLEDRLPGIRLERVRLPAEPELEQDLFDQLPRRTPVLGRGAAIPAEVADRRLLSLVSGCSVRDDHDEVGRQQLAELQLRRRLQQAADREVQRAGLQQSEQLGIETDVELDLRGGSLDDEARQQRLADEPGDDVPGADADLADLAGRQQRDFALAVFAA